MSQPDRMFFRKFSFFNGLALICGGLVLTGCGNPPDRVEISETVERSPLRPEPNLEATSQERFRFASEMAPMAQPMHGAELAFHWETPEGWQELPPDQFRKANLRIGPSGEGEVTMSVLPGGGGDPMDNVNRWRGQMGVAPYRPEEFAALERYEVMGQEAVYVEFDGAYSGMGDTVEYSDAKLVGLVTNVMGNGVFIKMVGPAEIVNVERQAFSEFVESLHASTDGHTHDHDHPVAAVSAAAGETALGSDSAALPEGHPPIDGSVDTTAGTLPPGHPPIAGEDMQVAQAQAVQADSAQDGDDAAGGEAGAGAYTWTVPEGWTKSNDRPMRLVTYTLGPENKAECYISVLGGTAGGMTMNLNRWRGQFGQPPLSDEEIEELPKVELLGEEVPLLQVSGDFTGMGGQTQPDQMLLGAAYVQPSGSVFVKMTGPQDVVEGQVEKFTAFCASMRERE